MLLLLAVAFFSTSSFYSEAKQRGHHPGKAASLPLLTLCLLLIVDYFTSPLLATALDASGASYTACLIAAFSYNVFLICIYLAFIRENWHALTQHGRRT